MLSEFNGHHCQHRSDDFPEIAAILKPHAPKLVVELGTDRGGFSAFLAALVRKWGGEVFTFDIEAKFKPSLLREFPNLHFTAADIIGSGPLTGETPSKCERHPEIAALVARPGVFLYCDNGHKKTEIELYAPLLQVGSVLGVHDYNTEIMADWVEPFVAALGFEREGHERMEALRNEWYPEPMSRFWVRRRIIGPLGPEQTVKPSADPVVPVADFGPATAPPLPIDTTDIDAGWFVPDAPAQPKKAEDDDIDELPTFLTRVKQRLTGGRR